MATYHQMRLALVGTVVLFLVAGSLTLVQARELYSTGRQIEPTPDPCQGPVLEPTLDGVNVRSGPSVSFPVVADLLAGELAPIVGRAEYARFWQIELPDGSLGWVSDEVVLVSGYIEDLPIVDDEVDAGPEVTPWSPAADVECPATPTSATAVTESTVTQAATPTPPVSWSEPVNLSQSGGATTFRTVVTSTRTMHVLWQETGIDSFFYVRGFDQEWTQPRMIEVPFGTEAYYPDLQQGSPIPLFLPELVADGEGRIHAFWIDDVANLQYSRTDEGAFDSFEAWTTRASLAEGVLIAKAVADSDGRVHLAYMRSEHSETSPAGVYYRQYNADAGWSEPSLVYQSLYIHTLDAERANLQITTAGEDGTVYIVWDNPLLEQVFLARSAGEALSDEALSWEPVMLVDGREAADDVSVSGPSKITIGARGDEVVLLWQAGHDGSVCQQYFIWSTDGGESWQPREQLGSLADCATDYQFIASDADRPIFLLITVHDQSYLLTWDGEQWSEPRLQEPLVQFANPETNQMIELGCHQGHLIDANELAIVGCNEGSVKDIWFISRPLGDGQEWFPPPSVWSEPELTIRSSTEPRDLQLIADAEDRLHLIWAQENSENVYYALRDVNWSQPLGRLTSPDGVSKQPSATLAPDGRLLVVWANPQSGSIYFSAARASEAVGANTWLSPVAVATARSVAISPEIEVGGDGVIYVAYAVALNEGRGIYLTQSRDDGSTWSTPSLVYDASSVVRGEVFDPDLFVDGDGQLHLLWHQRWLPPESVPYSLYYMRSEDAGESWSSPEVVLEGPVRWSALIGDGDNWLYRIWQVSLGETASSLQFQSSQDFGRSWSSPGVLINHEGQTLPAAVTVDQNNKAHLFQLSRRVMYHWIAENGSWSSAEGLELEDGLRNPTSLVASAGPSNMLSAAFVAEEAEDDEAGDQPFAIRVASRTLDETADFTPVAVVTSEPAPPTSTAPPTGTAAPAVSPTPRPSPTPTGAFPTELEEERDSGLFSFLNVGDRVGGMIGSILSTTIVVILLVAIVLGVIRIRTYVNGQGKR